jgi:GH18 family chitinase
LFNEFTHIHFAFPSITETFDVSLGDLEEQFELMKTMTGIKRIVSFGGWAFSTEHPTYTIFREGVSDANRLTFATNVVNFVNAHGLDGVDFNWEYPAAPDIPDIPPGSIEHARQYLEFLKAVKQRLPDKQVAIAAPASYWYLKGFPIDEIADVVDYIVYMTYDLHGQWDYGNKWTTSGCPEGNCVRSHINITETYSSLAMVTKAGVPSHKVVCGVASYGRSFDLEVMGCTGPNCHFTGTNRESWALPRRCTGEPGYLANAEIREILYLAGDPETGPMVQAWHDHGSNSDIMVYHGTDWVAYMSDVTKSTRTE